MQTIRQRVVAAFLEEASVNPGEISELRKGLQPDGRWKGVDYESKQRTNWPVFFKHMQPVGKMTRALYAPGSPLRNDPQLKAEVLSAVNAWLTADWQNPNWWYNQIGGPLRLGPVLLALEDDLTAEEKQQGIKILKRSKISMTGANKSWLAQVTINRGLLEKSPDVISSGIRAIEETISVGGREGIQSDWSFHQHGRCLYSNGYGAPFLRINARTAVLATGTSYAMKPASVEKLLNTALDGNQWMVYGPAQDYGANGRSITRPGENSGYLVPIVDALLQLPSERTEELEALKAHLADPAANPPLEGNRHFWGSDIMTHKRKGYYASARMYSTRVDNTDNPHNGEGLRNHYIADGCNFLFLDGREYRDIFGAWDWQKVPGTTVVQDGNFRGSPRRSGQTAFVGGASDGTYGVSAFDFKRGDQLRARKSWFFFDEEYVCLGAGIASPSSSPVFTTLNQSHLRGEVTVASGSEARIVPQASHSLSGPVAVHHDGVGYIVLGEADTLLRTVPQTGRWSDINKNGYAKTDESTHDVFLLSINHGRQPQNAGYAYIVAPGMDATAMASYAANPAVEILSNTASVQAVRHAALGITQAVFYEAGQLAHNNRRPVSVDTPCVLMARTGDGKLHLSIADPTQKRETVKLTLPGRFGGDGCTYDESTQQTEVTIPFPTGGDAGKSVGLTLAVLSD